MSKELTLDNLRSEFFQQEDNICFIYCVSFEDRSVSVPQALDNSKFAYSLMFISQESNEFSSRNKKIADGLKIADVEEVHDIYTDDPIKTSMGFYNALVSIFQQRQGMTTVVDISTFTRETLLILLGTLHKLKDDFSKLKLVYTAAKAMDNDWLSRGVSDYRSVLGYSGEFSLKKPVHLVLLTGFELDRAIATIEEYEPSIISIGVGDQKESINPKLYDRNVKYFHDLVNIYGSRVQTFTFSLINPFKCRDAIWSHISKCEPSNVVIAPLSNKLSTVGAGLLGLSNPSIQICYTKPLEYNYENYSVPDIKAYVVDVSF